MERPLERDITCDAMTSGIGSAVMRRFTQDDPENAEMILLDNHTFVVRYDHVLSDVCLIVRHTSAPKERGRRIRIEERRWGPSSPPMFIDSQRATLHAYAQQLLDELHP